MKSAESLFPHSKPYPNFSSKHSKCRKMENFINFWAGLSWIVQKWQYMVLIQKCTIKSWMSWTAQCLNGFNWWKIEENIRAEVGGGLRPPPIGCNVKFVEKLKSWSTLKLNYWKLVKAIKKTRSNFEGLNVLTRREVEWLKMVENWKRRYISKEVKIWGMVELCPIDSHVKNWA